MGIHPSKLRTHTSLRENTSMGNLLSPIPLTTIGVTLVSFPVMSAGWFLNLMVENQKFEIESQ